MLQRQIQRLRRLQTRPLPFRNHQVYRQIQMHTELMATVRQPSVKLRRIRRDLFLLAYATKMDNEKVKCHKCPREIGCKGYSIIGLRRHLYSYLSVTVVRKFNSLLYDCIIKDGRSSGDFRKPGYARLGSIPKRPLRWVYGVTRCEEPSKSFHLGYLAPSRHTVQ